MRRGFAAFLAMAFAAPVLPVTAASAQEPLTSHSVSMTVLSASPTTPASSNDAKDFSVVLRLVNTTDESLSSVTIEGQRGEPLGTQQALDQAITHPDVPGNLTIPIPPKGKKPVGTALSAHGAATVTFTTTTSLQDDGSGLCICANQIYPLYFTAHTADVSGAQLVVGSTQTYTPAFYKPTDVQPAQVSWLWPIIERPHRLVDDQLPGEEPVFLDDELALDVATGRLSRLVDVLAAVAGQVPMTVVIDPELIDELAIMAAGPYRVGDGKKTVAGVGTDAAKNWLEQLRTALAQPNVEVSFTPFADPDVQSLVNVGLNWTQTLGTTAKERVATALGNPTDVGNVWWPVGESLDQAALAAIVQHGATSVVLNDRTLPSTQQPVGNGLATVQTSAGPISAVVTASSIEHFVGSAMSTTGHGLAVLPELVAEVAIRAIENPIRGSYVAITPPRDLDPDPTNAIAAILGTAHQFWSKGRTVGSAVADVQPGERGQLVPPQQATTFPSAAITAARQLLVAVPALSSVFSPQDADRLLGSLPAGVQRAESASWRTDPTAGVAFADKLNQKIRELESGVVIVTPPNGRYTLASDGSPLPLTIHNTLPVAVTVTIEVAPKNGLPGFEAQPLQKLVIAAGAKPTFKIPTHVNRTGRFSVVAQLYTPTGHEPIGDPVLLSVHSTGLGLIGVIITVVAGAILALALVIRVLRRLRGRGRPTPPAGPVERVAPEPVSA